MIYSLIVCDRCPAELRIPHAVAPLPEAHRAWWVTITHRGRDMHLCPECGRDE